MIDNFGLKDTIVALSTPVGSGGIGIVRLSGEKAIGIADKLFCSKKGNLPSTFKKRELVLGEFKGENVSDTALCVVFDNKSFTGEETVEFQCHGGVKLTDKVIEECIKNGARMARNGEFSLRAFLNGKMSLCEAEAMIGLINATSEAEIKANKQIMDGGLTKRIEEFQNKVVDLMSEVEVSFDYPEEDIEYIAQNKIKKTLNELVEEINGLINTFSQGAIIQNGINACLIGKPNVGKSSILNALLNKDKAIVTDIAGTTRDVIEDAFEINGVKVNILDTAGIRNADNVVEKMGVQKSIDLISRADIVLFIVDESRPKDQEDAQILALLDGKKYITIHNKIDLTDKVRKNEAIYTSCKTGEGIDRIKQKIYDMVTGGVILGDGLVVTNIRHKNALESAKNSFENALKAIDNTTLDALSVDLMDGYTYLGQITGNTSNEQILDSIFSKFCLGK